MLRSRNRRLWVKAVVAASATSVFGAARSGERSALRIGTTPVFLDEQIGLVDQWRQYLAERLAREVRFVQRRSYREITDLLLRDELEAAWVCGYPYVLNRSRLNLCAVPVYQGQPLYRSYVIVPETDRATARIEDLKGSVYAFSDPQSNSGYLVPFSELARDGYVPGSYFKRTFFTFGHRKVVEAVAVGLAHGGSVDGYVWDTMSLQMPASVAKVRVAWRSPLHGFPPIVTRRSLDESSSRSLSDALLTMDANVAGTDILKRLNIDRFAAASPDLFASIERLVSESGIGRG